MRGLPRYTSYTRPFLSVRTINLASHQTQRLVLPVQLIPLPRVRHLPVALHHPFFFPTQDFVQVPRHLPMQVHRTGWLSSKSSMERLQILPVQKPVRAGQIVDSGQAQFFDQAGPGAPRSSVPPALWLAGCGPGSGPRPTVPSPGQTGSAASYPPTARGCSGWPSQR